MKKNKVHVYAPATVANVVCGFDVLGFAVDAPGDEIIISRNKTGRVNFNCILHNGMRKLPNKPEKNSAGNAVLHFLKTLKIKEGVDIELIKKMPVGSGMGSSAASAAAGVFAVNELFGKPLKREELIPFAMEGERAACGSAHADNVAPSLLGGLVLIRSYEPFESLRLPVPEDLFCVLVHPHFKVSTRMARAAIGEEISLQKAIKQWGNVGALVAGFCAGDIELIGRSMSDEVAEPARTKFIPGFHEMKSAVMAAGATGFGISGSGPSVFAFCRGKKQATELGKIIRGKFSGRKISSDVYISLINKEGAKILN